MARILSRVKKEIPGRSAGNSQVGADGFEPSDVNNDKTNDLRISADSRAAESGAVLENLARRMRCSRVEAVQRLVKVLDPIARAELAGWINKNLDKSGGS